MKYAFKDLIDITSLQELTDELYRAAGIPSAIITTDGEILTRSGWQKICTEFHRKHPLMEQRCIASDNSVNEKLDEGQPFVLYQCPHGLADASAPVIIEGEHVANVFAGQLFTATPDDATEQYFREQARRYGLDEAAYIDAFREIPIVSESQFRSALSFLSKLAGLIANMGLARMRELESIEQLSEASTIKEEIINNAMEGIIVYDQDLRYVAWNSFMERISGRPAHEVIGRHPLDVFPYLKDVGILDQLPKVLAGDTPEPVMFPFLDARTGLPGWFIGTSAPLRNAHGEIFGVIVTVQDVTARKNIEDDLRQSDVELRTAQRMAHVGSWTWDIKSNRYEWSDEMYQIFGVNKHSLSGSLNDVAANCIHPDDRSNVERALLLVLEKKNPIPFEHRIVHEDGSIHNVWVENGELVVDVHGNPSVLTGIVQDITERKKAEEERMKLEVQLFQAQRIQGIGTLASGIAHDFNNILQIITGNLSGLARAASDPEKLSRRIEAMSNASERAFHLVKQLLTFARKAEVKRRPVALNEMILDTVKLLGETFPKTIVIALELDPSIPTITADVHQLPQVFLNLAVNARDAMPDGGELRFSTSVVSGESLHPGYPEARYSAYIKLIVKDSGIGMDEATRKQVFDPFFTTKEIGKGTGLGLSVAQGIVQTHEGHIEVESEPGVGTSFVLYLPVSGVALDSVPLTGPRAQEIPGGTETILFIEDEKYSRDTTYEYFTEKGYTLLLAENGESGVKQFSEHKESISLVISDYGLPVFNGEEVYSRIRQIDENVPFLLLSGFLEPEKKISMLSRGVSAIVQKPYKPSEILSIVRRVLDQKTPMALQSVPAGSKGF